MCRAPCVHVDLREASELQQLTREACRTFAPSYGARVRCNDWLELDLSAPHLLSRRFFR